MTQGGKKKMKIKVKKATGEIDAVLHENDDPATPVTEAELQQIYQSPDGFRYVGVILHAVTNPKCTYVITASGRAVKVGENFGLRVTWLGDVRERIEAMAPTPAPTPGSGDAVDVDPDAPSADGG